MSDAITEKIKDVEYFEGVRILKTSKNKEAVKRMLRHNFSTWEIAQAFLRKVEVINKINIQTNE